MRHKNPRYGDLEDEWCSSLCQALATSSLVRAHLYTRENHYLDCAFSAMEFMISPVSSGGTMRMINENKSEFIYEEYPRKNISGVINGYISAIIALYEINNITQDYDDILSSNIANLIKILPYYDVGYWSLYSYDGTLSSGFYHRYLITQLRSIIHIIDLTKYAIIFEKYLNFKCASHALIKNPRNYKVKYLDCCVFYGTYGGSNYELHLIDELKSRDLSINETYIKRDGWFKTCINIFKSYF